MRLLAPVIILALAGQLAGCLVIPTDYHTPFSRENVDQELVAGVRPGMSREELLLLLGEPDQASADETELWYIATKVKAIIVAGYSGDEIRNHYIHDLRFAPGGLLAGYGIQPVGSALIDAHEIWSSDIGMCGFTACYQPEPHFPRPLPLHTP